jgi:hypothetical protein
MKIDNRFLAVAAVVHLSTSCVNSEVSVYVYGFQRRSAFTVVRISLSHILQVFPWLGGEASWDGTPVNYEEYYPITYVVIGEVAMPIIRSIVGHEDDCPIPQHKFSDFVYAREDGATSVVHADGRYIGNDTYPYKFPVKVCSINIAALSTCRLALDEGVVVLSFRNKTFPVPRVKLDPKRFLLIGDTGLRSKPKNMVWDLVTAKVPRSTAFINVR